MPKTCDAGKVGVGVKLDFGDSGDLCTRPIDLPSEEVMPRHPRFLGSSEQNQLFAPCKTAGRNKCSTSFGDDHWAYGVSIKDTAAGLNSGRCQWYWEGDKPLCSKAGNSASAVSWYDNAGWKCAKQPDEKNATNFCDTSYPGFSNADDFKYNHISDRSSAEATLPVGVWGRENTGKILNYLRSGANENADLTCCYNPSKAEKDEDVGVFESTHEHDDGYNDVYDEMMSHFCTKLAGAEQSSVSIPTNKSVPVLPLEGKVTACAGVAAETCAKLNSRVLYQGTINLSTATSKNIQVPIGHEGWVGSSPGSTEESPVEQSLERNHEYVLAGLDQFNAIGKLTYTGKEESDHTFSIEYTTLNIPTGMSNIWILSKGNAVRCARVDKKSTCFAEDDGETFEGREWKKTTLADMVGDENGELLTDLSSMIASRDPETPIVTRIVSDDDDPPLWVCPLPANRSIRGDGAFRNHTCSRMSMAKWGLGADAGSLSVIVVQNQQIQLPLSLTTSPVSLAEEGDDGALTQQVKVEQTIFEAPPSFQTSYAVAMGAKDTGIDTNVGTARYTKKDSDGNYHFAFTFDEGKKPAGSAAYLWLKPTNVDIVNSETSAVERCQKWWRAGYEESSRTSDRRSKMAGLRTKMAQKICQEDKDSGTVPLECYCAKAQGTTRGGDNLSPRFYALHNNNAIKVGEQQGSVITGQTYCWWPACIDADGATPTGDFIGTTTEQNPTCPNVCVISVNNNAGRDIIMNDNTFNIKGCDSQTVGCDGCTGSNMAFDACGVCGGSGPSGCGCGIEEDACGKCGGNGSTCAGCDGVMGSNMKKDECQVCGGPGIPGPNGECNCNGDVKDACGICGGDGSRCKGCDGVMGSNKKADACGVCEGDGSTCPPEEENEEEEKPRECPSDRHDGGEGKQDDDSSSPEDAAKAFVDQPLTTQIFTMLGVAGLVVLVAIAVWAFRNWWARRRTATS